MKNQHAISQFQDWFENRMSKQDRKELENHLEQCEECKRYFIKMSSLLEVPDKDSFPELHPDPFMATRIKAMAHKKSAGTRVKQWMKWTLVGAASSVAIFLGVELGNGLYTTTQNDYSTKIAATYYQAFNQNGIADQWKNVIDAKGDKKK